MGATEALQQDQLDALNAILQRQADMVEFQAALIGQVESIVLGVAAAFVLLYFIDRLWAGRN